MDKSDSSVPKGASKKQRTQQTVSAPFTHKEILSQFEFVPRPTSRFEEMDRGDNDTDGVSANSTRILSPDTLDSCTSQLSQPISRENKGVTNEDPVLKLCNNGTEISKLAQTVELRAAVFTLKVDNDKLKKEVAEAKRKNKS